MPSRPRLNLEREGQQLPAVLAVCGVGVAPNPLRWTIERCPYPDAELRDEQGVADICRAAVVYVRGQRAGKRRTQVDALLADELRVHDGDLAIAIHVAAQPA